MDMTETIVPDSTQLNAEDMLSGPVTVTVAGVERGSADQPVNIILKEFPDRAYRPCKSMRRVLVFAWGPDASAYVGRRMTLYNDQTVKWGGAAVGGIRISSLSHIEKPLTISLTETRGKRKPHRVEPLPDDPTPAQPKAPTATGIIAAFDSLGVTVEQLEARIGSAHDKWAAEDIAGLAALGKAIKAGTSTVYEEFETAETTEAVGTQGELQ